MSDSESGHCSGTAIYSGSNHKKAFKHPPTSVGALPFGTVTETGFQDSSGRTAESVSKGSFSLRQTCQSVPANSASEAP